MESKSNPIVYGNALAWLLMYGSAAAGAIYAVRRLFASAPGGNPAAVLKLLRYGRYLRPALLEIAATSAAGYVTGWLLRFLFSNLFPPDQLLANQSSLSFERFVCFAVPVYLLVFFAEATLLVGITTKFGTSDHDREWWARSAALMFMVGIAYLLLATCTVLLPVLVAQIPAAVTTSLGGISGVTAWVLARSEKLGSRKTEEERASKIHAVVLSITAATTLLLILALLSLATTYFLKYMDGLSTPAVGSIFGATASPAARLHLAVLQNVHWTTIALVMDVAFGIAVAMSFLLDANVYSMHGMYRNRLIRAYLGASRWFRRPDPFTGFDPQDDMAMFELRAEAVWSSSFVDFAKFAEKLNGLPLAAQLPPDVATRLAAFVTPGSAKPPSDEIRSDIVRALNELMVTRDLRHDLPAPPSVALFAANRRYLERVFRGLLTPAPGRGTRPRRREASELRPGTIEAVAVSNVDPRSEQEERIYAELEAAIGNPSPERRRPPLHVVSAALNLVGGDNLAWQERKADSFTISPLHCGNRRLGYRDSFDYASHITLGTAMAISGAAVSPNRGHSSSPILTFLMTLFNARLGWWLGNPKAWTYKLARPPSALQSLAEEALGRTNDTSNFVFLSDGGHFDNLGIYEMVRRRCRYIIACDATADHKYAFGDLANAVRKVRIDMGIPITLSTSYLAPEQGQKHGRYCATGLIHYGDVDQVPNANRFGFLVYIKPAVYSDCPPDISNYKRDSDQFPHESTIDQFFAESQFESYRVLGRHMVGRICNDQIDSRATRVSSVAAFVLWAKAHVDANRVPQGNVPVTNIDDVVTWMSKSLNG
jgi:hypothetical protein